MVERVPHRGRAENRLTENGPGNLDGEWLHRRIVRWVQGLSLEAELHPQEEAGDSHAVRC